MGGQSFQADRVPLVRRSGHGGGAPRLVDEVRLEALTSLRQASRCGKFVLAFARAVPHKDTPFPTPQPIDRNPLTRHG